MKQGIGELWQKSGGNNLLTKENFQDLYDSLDSNQIAFQLDDKNLRCIDEGTPGGIHLAGSGILYHGVINDLQNKVTGVYSHAGCGAAKLYTEKNNIETDDPDEVGDQRAKKIAEELHVPFLGRITSDQMSRPEGFHDARVIYYDGTGHFDPSKVSGLPKGFLVSRQLIQDPGYAIQEVEIAIGIAMGDHGFGVLFSKETPLYLVAVTNSDITSIPLETLLDELEEVIAGENNRVAVDTIQV